MDVRSMDDIILYREIFKKKLRRISVIRVDASNPRRGNEYVLGLFIFKKFLHRFLVYKVKFIMSFIDKVCISVFFQSTKNGGSNQSFVPSYINFRIFFHF